MSYNTLNNREISDEAYKHVLYIWEAFKMNSMKDYHDVYLKVKFFIIALCV